jgi:hypothetical protein
MFHIRRDLSLGDVDGCSGLALTVALRLQVLRVKGGDAQMFDAIL